MADTPTTDPAAEQNAFLCAIGHICLQWALLEQNLLFVIGTIENMPIQKAYGIFARLDADQRASMAVQLAQQAGLPHLRFVKPLMDVQKAMNRDKTGLTNRRNMFVHGVHKLGTNHGEYVLTMTRWKGPKQSQTVTLLDAGQLAHEILMQSQKVDAVFCDYGLWKFGAQNNDKGGQQIPQTKAALRVIRAQQLKRAFKLLVANLKPV